MPAYSVINAPYAVQRAEVLYRLPGTETWHQFGDVDNFTLSITPTKITRFRKNAAVRTKAAEIVNQVDSAITFRCMQFSQFVRAVAVLGAAETYTQAAVVGGSFAINSLEPGLYYLGKQDISVSGIVAGDVGDTALVAGTHYKVVDPELGMIEIIALPAGVTKEDGAIVSFAAAAVDATDGRVSARVASQTEIKVELMVRDVGRDSVPQVLHLYDVSLAPTGDITLIGEDDFSGVDISGSATDTSNGIGLLIDLAA